MTESIKKAVAESSRRRVKQLEYNKEHGISHYHRKEIRNVFLFMARSPTGSYNHTVEERRDTPFAEPPKETMETAARLRTFDVEALNRAGGLHGFLRRFGKGAYPVPFSSTY